MPHSGEYLADFAKHTTAQRAWHIGQGKTETMPRPIAQRASNDPRGQYPNPDTRPVSNEMADESALGTIADGTMTSTTKTHSSEAVDNFDQQSKSDTTDKVLASDESTLESLVQPLDDITDPTDEAKDDGKASDIKAQKMDDKADETTKTSPASYKDMIESVSGQLLQPMGILNLVTPKKPKPPKTKTPKPPKPLPNEHPRQPKKQKSSNANPKPMIMLCLISYHQMIIWHNKITTTNRPFLLGGFLCTRDFVPKTCLLKITCNLIKSWYNVCLFGV